MSTSPIVAGTDGSEESLRAVEWAAREAVLRGAPLRIVSAPALLLGMALEGDILSENCDHALAKAVQRAVTTAPELVVGTARLSGPVAHAVTRSGAGAAMLVVGSRCAGAFTATVRGSVGRYAATHASCPVVVVRDHAATARRQICVSVGDADSWADALVFAFEEAAVREAGLTVVDTLSAPRFHIRGNDRTRSAASLATTRLAELLAGWQDKHPDVQVTHTVLHGHPGRVLADLSAHTDLVVIGGCPPHETDIRGPGAITQALLNHAHGPVVTIPSPL